MGALLADFITYKFLNVLHKVLLEVLIQLLLKVLLVLNDLKMH